MDDRQQDTLDEPAKDAIIKEIKNKITEKRTQLYRKSENKNKKQKNYKLENILFPEKRSFRRKDLDDRIMLGDVNNPDYRTVLTNGKYFYQKRAESPRSLDRG